MDTEVIERNWNDYMAAFGALDEHVRARLLESSVTDDVIFTNPGGEGQSRTALSAHIGKFQTANPGAYFSTDTLYTQPDKLLAVWSMHRPDGTKVATGYNFVQPAQDGRFSYMAGFF